MADGDRGAYGLRVLGVEKAAGLLVGAVAGWPPLRMAVGAVDGLEQHEHIGERRAVLHLQTGGRLDVDRETATAHFRVGRHLSADELVHPYLAPAAAIAAHWAGRTAFHAGAIATEGGVWGVVGERERGKSSLLAHLSSEGVDVVADDVLVLGDGIAFAGPRSIDLRQDAAAHLGAGVALGTVGQRDRWRVALPQIAPELPFRGWIFLAWGEAPELVAVSASECLVGLMGNLALRVSIRNPAAMLAFAALPAWVFVRPRTWGRLAETADALLRGIRRIERDRVTEA